MKKRNEKGFFLSETMVVIAVVAVVLLGVFKLFSSVYYGFTESENYNTTNAINALSNIQKYYESIEEIDVSVLTASTPYVNLTDDEKYASDYYNRIKDEYNVSDVYLMDLNYMFTNNNLDNLYALLRRYINTLKNEQGTVLVVAINGNEFAYVKIKDYRNLTLIGNPDDEFAVYIPVDGEFIDPGYTGWNGETPYIEWENDKIVDTSKEGTYYLHYDFDGYLFRRKVVVGEVNGVDYIDYLYETFPEENGLIKDDTDDENIRYAGNNDEVNNYVYFGNTNELWRIIGVFDLETSGGMSEKLMKLVRDDSLISASWDSSASGTNYGYGINEWGQADIKTMLNTYYIGESTTCTYCNTYSQETCSNDCASSVTPINSTYKNMIEEVVWHTGGFTYTSVTPAEAYAKERPTEIGANGEGTGKICTSGSSCNDSVTRTIEWTGKVGLIYPSDYGFAGGTSCTNITSSLCGTSNWLKPSSWSWTISPNADSSFAYYVWNVRSDGSAGGNIADIAGAVRPSVYLKSDIQITHGNGTKTNPYRLSLIPDNN